MPCRTRVEDRGGPVQMWRMGDGGILYTCRRWAEGGPVHLQEMVRRGPIHLSEMGDESAHLEGDGWEAGRQDPLAGCTLISRLR